MSLEGLRSHGDFGIGTYEGLDGEMILLDGIFYQVRADGKVYRPGLVERTPFAAVTEFVPDVTKTLTAPLDMKALERLIDELVPQRNRFCAIRLRGDFSAVRTRSVPLQHKPYPPLVEVTRHQPVFSLARVRGTIVGFRSPDFVKGVNVPGYHLHFLADDHSAGGHVLDLAMTSGTLEIDSVHDWLHIILPGAGSAFAAVDLGRDRGEELRAVEQENRAVKAPVSGAAQGSVRE